ncbi:MAG: hypothetical protein NTW30_05190 [Candidatus Aenigmarchaeota archaeon]|nr:hypothetical protein [Candidatus Aenigmarchaeota archaeon]
MEIEDEKKQINGTKPVETGKVEIPKIEIPKFKISRDEWIAIGSLSAFAFIWMLFIAPFLMTSNWFLSLIPPIQYFLYNFGVMIFTFVVLGTPLSYTLKHHVDIKGVIRGGLTSWLFVSFVIDTFEPPYIIGPDGRMLIINMESLVGTSPDYTLHWIYTTLFPGIKDAFVNLPFSGSCSLLFLMIYLFSPIFAVVIMAFILKPGMLRKLLLK